VNIRKALRQFDGPLTAELVLAPGEFGLGQVPARLKPDATVTTVCGFCSTGCGLTAHLRNGQAINLTPEINYPVNLGMACPKGWEALAPLRASDRATSPLLRNTHGDLDPITWEAALKVFVEKFKSIQRRHGREALAWLGTGQTTCEELAFLGAVAKFGMGIPHGDGNTRQCMATAVTAYKEAFGFDAPPYTYADFEQSDVIVLIGSNLCIAHPILWQRVLRNPNNPEIIVVDPRRTETAMCATQHYALKPKSDLILLYGLAHILIQQGWIHREYIARHTKDFERFAEFAQTFTPEVVSSATGLTMDQITRLSETVHRGQRVSFWWTMGVNQGHEATRTAQAIINLALMTGNMGRPGTGANSITGQCNAMGSRLFSNTTNLLGGHDFKNPEHRQKVAGILGIPIQSIPQQNSLAYDQIVEGIAAGKIKGLWVIATNTAHSWIEQLRLTDTLKKLEFLVVQDMYASTETARIAGLILPAAGWGEKEGTFINSERRVGHVKRISRAPGQALADFHIVQLLAHAWGCGEMFARWKSPEVVFQLLKELTRGQPCDITGMPDYEDIDACGGIQWPLPDRTPDEIDSQQARERRLFADGKYFHADGRARFIFETPRALPENTDAAFPFLLLTGRGSSAQWHTGTRTEKSDVLRKLRPEGAYIEMNPADAERLGVVSGRQVQILSRRAAITATAFLTPTIQCGQVFMPMHYAVTNRLTLSAVDPYSRQPAFKACAVRIEKI
jgi:anaerobic selenocysteine-containing dehydrogenase